MKASPMSLFEEFIKEAYGSQYVIPVYQRNYTWKKNKQIQQLLDDIENILKGNSIKHFIGTIVYVIVDTNFMVRERAIVDGQQRLVTMFLIAYALLDIVKSMGDKERESIIKNNYLENIGLEKYKYRLKPAVSDDDAYSYIAREKADEYEGKSLLMDNYMYIKVKLSELVDRYEIDKVFNAIRELYIVRIELDKNDDAQQIFESINSTGEKLTSADLIRNFIMMNKSNAEQEKIYFDYWDKLEKLFVESKKISEFFRFYLAAKTYELVSEKDLYGEFKLYWKKNSNGNYTVLLDDILNYAKHFSNLYFENNCSELESVLRDFRTLQGFMPAPFAMRMLEHYRKKELNKQQITSIIKILTTYLIRRHISGEATSAISRFFPIFLKNVESRIAKDSFARAEDIVVYYLVNNNKGRTSYMPDDTQIRTYLKTANAYTLSNIRWVLNKIETYNNPIGVDLSSLNIEHIMPQTKNEYWEQVTGLDDDEYIDVVNRFGNLTLAAVTDNSSMGNNDFKLKKDVLSSTKHLILNEPILDKEEWTVEEIDKRTEYLVDKFVEIFPYVKTNYTAIEKDENRMVHLKSKGIKAFGQLNLDGSLTVFAQSMVNLELKPTQDTLAKKREELLDAGVIVRKNGMAVFEEACTFNSPSTATDIILGSSNNGWICWRDKDEQLINESLRNTIKK